MCLGSRLLLAWLPSIQVLHGVDAYGNLLGTLFLLPLQQLQSSVTERLCNREIVKVTFLAAADEATAGTE